MVQLIGNFDFAALCLPTVPWGKSTRKMQFFRKVIVQIPDRSVLFFESFFRVCFCGCRIIFFFSSNSFLFFPPIEFSSVGDHRETTAFRFQFWENQKRQRVHSTIWMFCCTLCTFLSRCVRLEEEKGDREKQSENFFNFKRLFWGEFPCPPLNHQLITKRN